MWLMILRQLVSRLQPTSDGNRTNFTYEHEMPSLGRRIDMCFISVFYFIDLRKEKQPPFLKKKKKGRKNSDVNPRRFCFGFYTN